VIRGLTTISAGLAQSGYFLVIRTYLQGWSVKRTEEIFSRPKPVFKNNVWVEQKVYLDIRVPEIVMTDISSGAVQPDVLGLREQFCIAVGNKFSS